MTDPTTEREYTEREYAAADLERVAREIEAIVDDRAESLKSAEIGDLLFAASTIDRVAFADKMAALTNTPRPLLDEPARLIESPTEGETP